MKGLWMKDMMTFRKMTKLTSTISTFVILGFLLFMKNEICFYIANFIILPLNAATHSSLLSYYDEQWKWKTYMIATPVSAKDIVVSRMMSAYLIFAIQSISVVLFDIVFFLIHKDFSRDMFAFVVIAAFLLSAISVSVFIMTDFLKRNNSKLASVFQFLLILLGAGLVYMMTKAPVSVLESLLSLSRPLVLCIMGGVFIVILFSAYFIAVPAVRKRH